MIPEALKNKLPTYAPPALVWTAIERQLNTNPETESNQNRIARTFSLWTDKRVWLGGWVAAASIVGLGLYWLINNQNEPIIYSQEVAVFQPVVVGSPLVEQQYAKVQAYCQREAASCEKPKFKALKRELDHLTSASNRLKETLGDFNTDRQLALQLTHIETERSQIIEKLIEQL